MRAQDTDRMANSVDPNQAAPLEAVEKSDLGLHCLLRPVCPNIYRNDPKFSDR